MKVLIVDDDPSALQAFAEVVKSYGGNPIQSTSARDAIDALTKFHPDVVVSDIAMPFENGYALIRKIRALPPDQGGQVPAIALTAYAAQHDIAHAIADGFQEHIAKPVGNEDFARVIARLAKPMG